MLFKSLVDVVSRRQVRWYLMFFLVSRILKQQTGMGKYIEHVGFTITLSLLLLILLCSIIVLCHLMRKFCLLSFRSVRLTNET